MDMDYLNQFMDLQQVLDREQGHLDIQQQQQQLNLQQQQGQGQAPPSNDRGIPTGLNQFQTPLYQSQYPQPPPPVPQQQQQQQPLPINPNPFPFPFPLPVAAVLPPAAPAQQAPTPMVEVAPPVIPAVVKEVKKSEVALPPAGGGGGGGEGIGGSEGGRRRSGRERKQRVFENVYTDYGSEVEEDKDEEEGEGQNSTVRTKKSIPKSTSSVPQTTKTSNSIYKHLKPGQTPWSLLQDEHLMTLVQIEPPLSYKTIAEKVGKEFNGDECKSRWSFLKDLEERRERGEKDEEEEESDPEEDQDDIDAAGSDDEELQLPSSSTLKLPTVSSVRPRASATRPRPTTTTTSSSTPVSLLSSTPIIPFPPKSVIRGRRTQSPTALAGKLFSPHGKQKKVHTCPAENCGAAFKRSEHLKRHYKAVHDGLKPFPCDWEGCGKSFSRRDNLQQHMSMVHGLQPAAKLAQVLELIASAGGDPNAPPPLLPTKKTRTKAVPKPKNIPVVGAALKKKTSIKRKTKRQREEESDEDESDELDLGDDEGTATTTTNAAAPGISVNARSGPGRGRVQQRRQYQEPTEDQDEEEEEDQEDQDQNDSDSDDDMDEDGDYEDEDLSAPIQSTTTTTNSGTGNAIASGSGMSRPLRNSTGGGTTGTGSNGRMNRVGGVGVSGSISNNGEGSSSHTNNIINSINGGGGGIAINGFNPLENLAGEELLNLNLLSNSFGTGSLSTTPSISTSISTPLIGLSTSSGLMNDSLPPFATSSSSTTSVTANLNNNIHPGLQDFSTSNLMNNNNNNNNNINVMEDSTLDSNKRRKISYDTSSNSYGRSNTLASNEEQRRKDLEVKMKGGEKEGNSYERTQI